MRWTAEEDAKLNELLAQGRTQKEITEAIGRSWHSTRGHIRWLRMTTEEKEHRAAQIRYGRKSRATVRIRRVEEISTREIKPEHVFIDAQRRSSTPRSLTALIMGDPPPGWSALDRKQGARP